ncbi:uncharacterized protein PAC_18663 [Phialocephala subalpina]|uniref:Uncharacterized protein n=1 Tax=Phialocephala subalpina TaxID=576137 RepID=A0A1L7XUQ8_9HELO|nr:uncharacterized protein PAC_18663 [Phialocephala subalpina]
MANTRGAARGLPLSLSPETYTVGWICAIPTELIAAKAMCDEVHGPLKAQPKHDENNYHLGRIGEHNVVIACLPRIGTVDAAVAGKSMQSTFQNLRFGLMVGVGGGIPSDENDIRLGDIAVSLPSEQAGGVIQYDMGKDEDGGFCRTGSLNSPPNLLLAAIQTLRAERALGREITDVVNGAFVEEDDEEWRFPANEPDVLFEDGYDHGITGGRERVRSARKSTNPKFFYGNIGSGNSVIKNAEERRRLAADGKLICFEMEAAGLMNFFKCIVIRGICDYADKHKHKKWQPYAASVAAAYAKKLLSLITPGAVEALEPVKKNQHWIVPRQINPHFTGRTQILQTLREKLCTGKDDTHEKVQKRFVIRGMGGSGKSEVCLKFAYENRENFWGIFWIDASDEGSIKRGVADAAKRASNGVDVAYADAKLWFENLNKSWLLILDNADNNDLNYLNFFPSGDSGCILMSTRVVECQQYNTVGYQDADFEKLGVKDSIELLLKSAHIPPEKWDWPQVLDDARKVVSDDCLGQHALAITQAGAFISQRLCTLGEYPAMFNKQRVILLNYRRKQAESRYGDVYATFEVSAEAMKATSHRQDWVDALELLNILAFLHREGVIEEMFTKAWTRAIATTKKDPEDEIRLPSLWHVNHMRRILRQSSDSPIELVLLSLRNAASALQSFSLITIHQETGDISMHALVHAWAKDRLAADAQNIAWATAASILSLSIESFGYREFFPKIQSHIEFSVGPDPEQLFANSKHPGLEIGRILYPFTYVMVRLRNDYLAEVLADVLCSRIGYEISPQSRNWRDVLYLQAMCKDQVAKYNEEMDILENVVLFDKYNLPAEDSRSAQARHLLGMAHNKLGNYPEAIGLFEDVLQTRRKLLAPTHPDCLISQHELAGAYLNNNQVDKALELLEEVTQIQEKTLLSTHPDRLASQHELAKAYLNNNQVDKAIELLEKVTQIREKTLLSTHPDRLASQHELARAYLRNNQVDKAIELFEEVTQIKEKTLLSTHPQSLISRQELARAYYVHGEYQKALPIIKEVVRIRSEQDEPGYLYRVYSEQILSVCRSGMERELSESGTIADASGIKSVAAAQD